MKISNKEQVKEVEEVKDIFTETYGKKLEELKLKHKEVWTLKIPTDDSGLNFVYGFIRKPNRMDMKIVMPLLEKDLLTAMERLLNSIWLDGDVNILSDDDLFYSAAISLQKFLQIRTAELKKN